MKLYYFDGPGIAEAIRLVLYYTKVPFEDIRMNYNEWLTKKDQPLFEFHVMPVLVLPDGTKISQSYAILEYLGLKYGYLPTDETSSYKIRNICETVNDLSVASAEVLLKNPNRDESNREKIINIFFKEKIHFYLSMLEDFLKNNISQEYFCGNSYTIADFRVMTILASIKLNPDCTKRFEEAFAQYSIFDKYIKIRYEDFRSYYESKNIKYKLYDLDVFESFGSFGRGESIRLLFKHAHIPFEDIKITVEEFKKLKFDEEITTAFENNEILGLEENGKILTQTEAILHKLGLRYNYLPVNEKENLLIEIFKIFKIMGEIRDLQDNLHHFTYNNISEEKKKICKDEYMNVTVPLVFDAIEKDLNLNLNTNETQDFLVGTNYTIADFFFIGFFRNMVTSPNRNFAAYFGSLLDKYQLIRLYIQKKFDEFYLHSAYNDKSN